MLKFTVLSENRKNGKCDAESGLSVFVENNGTKFLFDTGLSDVFLKNAEKLGIDADSAEVVILSHGHADHSNGIEYLTGGKSVIMHPAGFKDRYSIRSGSYAGFPYTKGYAVKKFNFVLTDTPHKIYDDVYFLGEIPRVIDFEGRGHISTTLDRETAKEDRIEDDSGIAIMTPNGLMIMSGCGHSGICNVIEHAKKVTGEDKIYGVLGGFHFVVPVLDKTDVSELDEIVSKTIGYFKENSVQHAFLGHCIKDEIINKFEEELKSITEIHRLFSGADFAV